MNKYPYQKREYRDLVESEDLVNFQAAECETDLYISADKILLKEALKSITYYRNQLKEYIENHPEFETSLSPVEVFEAAPHIVKEMAQSGQKAGVGPFAAVAGAVAEYVGRDLLEYSSQIIIENGGDIYLSSIKNRTIGLYAGKSPLTGKIGFKIHKDLMPIGICTSSGTVGHSLSFGKADAVVIVSKSTALADATATATANSIQSKDDIQSAIDFASQINGILAVAIIVDKHIGIWGELEIVKL